MLRILFLWLNILILSIPSVKGDDDIKFYGQQQGYDAEILKQHLMLTKDRNVLDLAGEWSVTINGITKKTSVPSCYDYSGQAVFRRTFIPGEEFRNKHFRFISYGINYKADIRINNEFITNVNYGYSHIEEDLSEQLIKIGEPNTIEIIVDSRVGGRIGIPTITSLLQPKPYGGIFREIFLLALPKTNIEKHSLEYSVSRDLKKCEFVVQISFRDYDYQYALRDTARQYKGLDDKRPIRYIIELFNEDDQDPVYSNRYKKYRTVWETPKKMEINEDNILLMGNMSAIESRFQIEKPVFWNPSSPYRYRMVLSLMVADTLVDQIQTNIGIMKTEVTEKKIIINSQSVILSGVEYYEDSYGLGNTLNYAVMEQDLIKIKELGANAIYFKNHPPHPYFMELCDRYGFLLLYQIPVNQMSSDMLNQSGLIEDIKNYYRTMISNDRHHPCILAWGTGENLDFSQSGVKDYYQVITQTIRNLDRRPVFSTSYFGSQNDQLLESSDIVVMDLRINDLTATNSFLLKNNFKNPAVTVIYGAHIFSNNQNGYSDPTSIKYQSKYIIDMFKRLQEFKFAGGLIRSFNDFSVNRPYTFANPNSDKTVFTTGLLTDKRKERMAFQITKALFTGDKYDPISVGSTAMIHPKIYPVIGLILVIVFIVFYRRSEKFGGHIFRSITKINNFFSDVRENRLIGIWPALIIGFLSSVSLATMLSILCFELRRNQIFDELLMVFFIFPSVKGWFDDLIWQPDMFIITVSFIIFWIWVALSVIIQLFGLLFKASLSFQQSLISGLWSGSHYIILIPLVIIFQRIMSIDFFMFLAILTILFVAGWHFIRLFKIFKIVYDTSWLRVILVIGGIVTIVIVSVSAYFQQNYYSFDVTGYIQMMYHSGNYSVR
jgi:hypothetical protein